MVPCRYLGLTKISLGPNLSSLQKPWSVVFENYSLTGSKVGVLVLPALVYAVARCLREIHGCRGVRSTRLESGLRLTTKARKKKYGNLDERTKQVYACPSSSQQLRQGHALMTNLTSPCRPLASSHVTVASRYLYIWPQSGDASSSSSSSSSSSHPIPSHPIPSLPMYVMAAAAALKKKKKTSTITLLLFLLLVFFLAVPSSLALRVVSQPALQPNRPACRAPPGSTYSSHCFPPSPRGNPHPSPRRGNPYRRPRGPSPPAHPPPPPPPSF